MSVSEAFDDVVGHYDQWIVKALPRYEELFRCAVSLIPFDQASSIDVIDLGAGTGLFSYHVRRNFKQAYFLLYDSAPEMLNAAKNRFKNSEGQIEFLEGDLRNLDDERKFDVAVSSLAIHHLDDIEKQRLFSTVYTKLRTPGVFINIDQIKAPTRRTGDLYWSTWIEYVREHKGDEEQLNASIRRRTQYDKDALLVDQIRWLSDAGFTDVDCIYKYYFVGVFYALKADGKPLM